MYIFFEDFIYELFQVGVWMFTMWIKYPYIPDVVNVSI